MKDKQKFVKALRLFSDRGGADLYDPVYKRTGYRPHRGERLIAGALAAYLEGVPGDVEGINWFSHLHQHLVDSFVEFREHEKWDALRAAYRAEAGDDIPDLINIHLGSLHRLLVAHELAYLVAVLSGEVWLRAALEAYFDAQQIAVDQAWRRFVRVGYRQIMPRIKDESHRGNSGKFGKTKLMTYDLAGHGVLRSRR